MVHTKHRYIHQTPVKPSDKSLILGTIHPHLTESFKIDYFYGNRASLWNILEEAFPNHDFSCRESIEKELEENRIWISDIISECDRKKPEAAGDRSLSNIFFNSSMISGGLKNSNISRIFFTSGMRGNGAAGLFCRCFQIKPEFSTEKMFTIAPEYFGRQIEAEILLSPSGQANVGISRSPGFRAEAQNYMNSKTPVKDYRIDQYRKSFSEIFGSGNL